MGFPCPRGHQKGTGGRFKNKHGYKRASCCSLYSFAKWMKYSAASCCKLLTNQLLSQHRVPEGVPRKPKRKTQNQGNCTRKTRRTNQLGPRAHQSPGCTRGRGAVAIVSLLDSPSPRRHQPHTTSYSCLGRRPAAVENPSQRRNALSCFI